MSEQEVKDRLGPANDRKVQRGLAIERRAEDFAPRRGHVFGRENRLHRAHRPGTAVVKSAYYCRTVSNAGGKIAAAPYQCDKMSCS